MAKYYGKIGYATTSESPVGSGLWKEKIVEKSYRGDVTRLSRRLEDNGVNDDVNVSNAISIVADPFATENFMNIRYVEWMGNKWKVNDIQVEYPRLSLTIGGLYNE